MILLEEASESSQVDQQQVADVAGKKHSLYLRFPKKLNVDRTLAESEVKSLHAKIIRVRIPRQRSANFCLVDFETNDEKEKAQKKLKKVEINGKHLVVKEAVRNDKVRMQKKIEKVKVKREVNEALGKLVGDIRNSLAKKYAQRNVTNGVMVRDIKAGTTLADIRPLFPQAIDTKLIMKAERKNSFALVWLPTPKDAREAAMETVQINGDEYAVSLQNDGKVKRRKRADDSNDDSDDDSSEDVSAAEESDVDDDESVDSEVVEEESD